MSSSNGNGNGNGHGQPAVIGPEFVPDEAMMTRMAAEALRSAALPAMAPEAVTAPAGGGAEALTRAFIGQGSPFSAPPLPPPPDLSRLLSGLHIPGEWTGPISSPEESVLAGAPVQATDPAAWRNDFPALHQQVHGKDLVWLDNAATTQKPQSVIDAISAYYEQDNSNVHRAAHALAGRATDAYESGRKAVADFIGASSPDEIVIVRGTTEAINLVAQTYGRQEVGPGDEIVLTMLEHHANIVPWQMLARETGARIRVVPMTDRGELRLEEYEKLLNPRVKIVGLTQVSNALGTVVPVPLMTAMAHRYGAVVVVDGAQAVSHFPVNVAAMDADFYAISGHKLFGPTGVGALYGKKSLLDAMPPWQGGGSMIKDVTFEHTVYNEAPEKFEAGTPIIAGAAGLAAAIDYLNAIGMEHVAEHEQMLTAYATQALAQVPGLRMIGTAPGKIGVLSFVADWMDTEDVGAFLDQEGIAVRAGHHCAQPCLRALGLEATVRPSLALYNTTGDVDALVAALYKSRRAGA
ncbi:MAG: cysteine desulfurase / selenocysteine lyase [Actinomycetota bacterium]|nr:cysteine desulfurase / selenocysteine lyase [Actinomycetota bacterium]